MKVSELAQKLSLECINMADDIDVTDCYIGDMLSVVMSKAPEGGAWLTVQTNINITAVSALVGLACVIVVEGMEIDDNTIKKAHEQEITILRTKETAYALAVKISELI